MKIWHCGFSVVLYTLRFYELCVELKNTKIFLRNINKVAIAAARSRVRKSRCYLRLRQRFFISKEKITVIKITGHWKGLRTLTKLYRRKCTDWSIWIIMKNIHSQCVKFTKICSTTTSHKPKKFHYQVVDFILYRCIMIWELYTRHSAMS